MVGGRQHQSSHIRLLKSEKLHHFIPDVTYLPRPKYQVLRFPSFFPILLLSTSLGVKQPNGATKLLCTNAHPLRSAVGNLLMCFFFFSINPEQVELIFFSLFQPQQGLYKWGVVLVVMKTMEGCMAKAMDPEVLWHGKTHGISDHAEIHGKSHGYWHGKSHAPKNFNFQRWWLAPQKHFT